MYVCVCVCSADCLVLESDMFTDFTGQLFPLTAPDRLHASLQTGVDNHQSPVTTTYELTDVHTRTLANVLATFPLDTFWEADWVYLIFHA